MSRLKPYLYENEGKLYDLVYSKKDYKKEVDKLLELISKYQKSSGKELLDVACGTGKHLEYLKDKFSCMGVDISQEMLDGARERLGKSIPLKKADMTKLNLGKKLDIIICLFSAIGYVKTYSNLRKTIQGFAKHLKRGGVVIIEPWLTKSAYKVGLPWMDTYEGEDIKIARLNVSKAKGDISVLDFHYLVVEKDKDVQHFTDRHELGMFGQKETLQIMEKVGFKAKFSKDGFTLGRGLYIGVKK